MSPLPIRKKQLLAACIIYALLINVTAILPHDFLWSLLPDERLLSTGHLIGYAVFGYLLCLGLVFMRSFFSIPMTDRNAMVTTFIICTLWGIFNELLQLFCPGRYSDPMDVVFNDIGVLIGIAIFFYRRRFLKAGRRRAKS